MPHNNNTLHPLRPLPNPESRPAPLIPADAGEQLRIRIAEWGFQALFTFYGFIAGLLGALNGLRRERSR